MLALVFVDAFHLDIEQRGRIDHNAGPFPDDFRQTVLVCQFHIGPRFLQPGIVRMGFERFEMIEIGQPALANLLIDQPRQSRITQGNEAPR